MKKRLVFMGTPEFAVPCLQALFDSGHDIVGVFTQPDRARGRGKKVAISPVKERALLLDVPVFQPEKLRDYDSQAHLQALNPDIIVVVAYGQILSQAILDMPAFGCINVHASLLPKYRGAAPIHRAIIDGETQTGIAIMLMDTGIDTGAVLATKKMEIMYGETTGELHDRLMNAGAELLVNALEQWFAGTITPQPQPQSGVTYAQKIDKLTERIDWRQSAPAVANLILGLNPWPGAFTVLGDKIIKIWRAGVCDIKFTGAPGEIVEVNRGGIFVMCGDGSIVIDELQFAGATKQKTADFVNSGKITRGERFE
ncbi:MAG: methionyl-tRNA formyltransferase [Bacillota bacterium]